MRSSMSGSIALKEAGTSRFQTWLVFRIGGFSLKQQAQVSPPDSDTIFIACVKAVYSAVTYMDTANARLFQSLSKVLSYETRQSRASNQSNGL